MRRTHWSTKLGAAVLALATLVLAGPVTVAVLMLRCCDDSTGPTAGAWVLLLTLLLLLTLVAAAIGGALGSLVHRLATRGRGAPPPPPPVRRP